MLYLQQYRNRVSSNPDDKEIKNPNALKKYQDSLTKS